MDLSYLKNLNEGLSKNQILHDLMIAYGDDVLNFAFSLTRSMDAAEDIRQDVFVKAFAKLETFRGESSPKSWLLSIARHAIIDRQRSAFIRKINVLHYLYDSNPASSAENEYFERQEISEVWKVVMQLPIKLREVIVLFAHHQLSIIEIATLLNLSESAVKVRLHRARKKVNKWFDESEGE